ncbi:BgTH12-01410 [Blumeria graminis f. sp. triticale]|uniref:Bgt-51771 n=2 Tax=Blumeria graminis TaxID=34373 RepID=A0A9X9MEJ1_BLUGR|nr:BgTH12-01410 [Blumeria graminis f. sp. triticale]VDB83557.1 Bgt-51771 [Blumeria graminis f. sp. tritici]
MKILSVVPASAFTFLLLLGSVVQGYIMIKCSTERTFPIGEMREEASKASYEFVHDHHPLGPDGQKCKGYQLQISSIQERIVEEYLLQVCGLLKDFRMYERVDGVWTRCRPYDNGIRWI